MKILSDLRLDGGAPIRVRPELGEWGPDRVPTTRQKKRQRVWVGIAFVVAVVVVFAVGYYFMTLLKGG